MARKKHKAGKSPGVPAAQIPSAALRFALPALVALFSLFAWSQSGIYEDGFFFLRVVDVFLHTGELAYNPGERFETNTDFLWTLLLIPGPAVGLDPVLWLQIAGLLVYAAVLLSTFVLARKLFSASESALAALALVGAHFSFAIYAVTGFGPVLQALATVCALLGLWRFGKKADIRGGVILGAGLSFLALCRLDSVVLGIPVGLSALFIAWQNGKGARTGIILALGIPTLLSVLLLLWKRSYYGDILPATYYIKAVDTYGGVDLAEARLRKGFSYALLYWQSYFLWALALAAGFGFWRARRSQAGKQRERKNASRLAPLLAAGGMVVLWHAYTIRVGGDYQEFRFFMPQVPAMMIVFAAGLREVARHWRWGVVAGAALASFAHAQVRGFEIVPGVNTARGDMYETKITASAEGVRSEIVGGRYVAWRFLIIPLDELFRHLGPYPPQVRIAFPNGGISGYSTRLLFTEMYGFADSRIGLATPEDVLYRGGETGNPPGHNLLARPHLLARIGVNLMPAYGFHPVPPDFNRPPGGIAASNPRLAWAAQITHMPADLDLNLPADSQLFTLQAGNRGFLPVLYFNRNRTIDRVLDERGIARINVF